MTINYCGEPYTPWTGMIYSQPTKKVKRITRTIEKWDASGQYLGKEVITEDIEDVEVPDYSWKPDYNDYPITCGIQQPSNNSLVTSYSSNVSFTSQN